MFKKDKCKNCNEKINKKDNFCPNCGSRIKENSEDYGMLGKNDFMEEKNPFEDSIFGGFGGGMINKMFSGAMKMLEKEIQKEMKRESQNKNTPNSHFELFINGKRISPDKIKVSKKQIQEPQKTEKQLPTFSNEKIEQFKKLEREEPKVNLKRFANKIIYEIEVPGIKSVENVSILKLENSIEIKAIGKKAYEKILTVNSPIINYSVSKDSLIIELGN